MTHWETLDATAWREAALAEGAIAGIASALDTIDRLNPQLRALTVILREQALARAAELDSLSSADAAALPLFGVPVVIKEEVDVAGCVTTYGTRGNVTPKTKDSEIVRRLRAAGAVIIAKSAMPAFGAFPFTESEAFGITLNPLNPAYSPGGSSGGTAAAVASGMVPVGIGGDGGGSIRIPSAHCGLVGLKPRRGVIPTAPYDDLWCALGTSGALTRTARDARLLFDILTDAPTSGAGTSGAVTSDAATEELSPLNIALDLRPISPATPLGKEHRAATQAFADKLRALGHTVTEVKVEASDPTPAFMVQFLAGIRGEIDSLEYPDRIEARHKRTKAMGFWVRPNVVEWAKKKSAAIGAEIEQYFQEFDLILTPTLAARPPKAGILTGMGTVRAQIASLPFVAYTARYNVSGHPAIAVPFGVAKDGLPISVQLVASYENTQRGEELLLDVAQSVLRA